MTTIILLAVQTIVVLCATPLFLGVVFRIALLIRREHGTAPWVMYRTMFRPGNHVEHAMVSRRDTFWALASLGVTMGLLVMMPLITTSPILPGIANPITIASVVLSAGILRMRNLGASAFFLPLGFVTITFALLDIGLAVGIPANVMALVDVPWRVVPVALGSLVLVLLAEWWNVRKSSIQPKDVLSSILFLQYGCFAVVFGVFLSHILLPYGMITQGASMNELMIAAALLFVRIMVVAVMLGIADGLLGSRAFITPFRLQLLGAVTAVAGFVFSLTMIFV